MGWSGRLINRLNSGRYDPIFKLQAIATAFDTRAGYSAVGHPGLTGEPIIGVRGFQLQGPSVALRTWQPEFGGFTVFVATPNPTTLFSSLRRGTLVQLLIGFPGDTDSDLEPFAFGTVHDIKQNTWGPGWEIVCLDPSRILQARMTTSASKLDLFNGITTYTTTIASDYTASDTTLEVADDVTGWPRDTDGDWLILITGDTEDFYATATGTATGPNRFTGVSGGALGTSDNNATTGNDVKAAWYLNDHPADVWRKVLLSTGTAASSFDTLPAEWGIGLPVNLIDGGDWTLWRNAVAPSSGTWAMQWAGTTSVENPYTTLQNGLLSPWGLWVTTRQGRFTFRAAQDAFSPDRHSGITITDADIDPSSLAISLYDPVADYEYRRLSVGYFGELNATVNRTSINHHPARLTYQIDQADYVFTNEVAIAEETRDRLAIWYQRIPSVLTFRCAGFRLSQLCPGDLVYLTTELTRARPNASRSTRINARTCMVQRVDADFLGDAPGVTLTLSMPPETEDV